MQATTPNFEDTEGAKPEAAPVEDVNELDLEVESDDNLDVDVPDDEIEDVSTGAETEEAKAAKATKSTPRAAAPAGFVKPVAFAKILSEHLGKPVPPQVVYSYIKNNAGESARNPFPVHEVEGYAWYIKPDEGLAWWDAKNSRVATAKATRAEKATKVAAKADGTKAEPEGPVEEAE